MGREIQRKVGESYRPTVTIKQMKDNVPTKIVVGGRTYVLDHSRPTSVLQSLKAEKRIKDLLTLRLNDLVFPTEPIGNKQQWVREVIRINPFITETMDVVQKHSGIHLTPKMRKHIVYTLLIKHGIIQKKYKRV